MKRDNPEQKQFLDQLSLLKEFTETLKANKKTTKLPQFLNVHLTALNGDATIQTEATKLLTTVVEQFIEVIQHVYGNDNVLIFCTTSKNVAAKRSRRAADSKNQIVS